MNASSYLKSTSTNNILTIKQVVLYVEKKYTINLYRLSTKRIFFVTEHDNFCLCSPSSKFHSTQQCYWVDITLKQKLLLDLYKNSLIVFRLEGEKFFPIQWSALKPFLNDNSQQYNTHELEHWKLYIYPNYIRIGKSNQRIKGKIKSLQGLEN